MERFKIDYSGQSHYLFGLYVRRPRWHYRFTRLTWWERLDYFEKREDAQALYERVKDLPQYLS